MKKLLLLATALLTLSTAHAELILHESFDRPVGTLKKGSDTQMGDNKTDWYSFSGSSNYISVVEGSLSYEGYAEAAGKKVELLGSGADDLRQFAPITSGKVYVGAIINIDSLKQYSSGTSSIVVAARNNGDYFLAMGDAGNSNMYARLYARSVKEEGAETYTKIQLGIAKYSEQSTSTTTVIPMVDVAMKQNILVVLEYEFVAGDKNDVARLYVNPTKETTTATLVCGLDVSTSAGSAIGANSKNDASKIASVNLRKGANTPGRVYVDEIKVATTWAELFGEEGGVTPPAEEPAEITVDAKSLSFGVQVYVGETYTTKFVVKGKNLKGDISLTSSNAELTLDKTTIAKADAESEGGVEVTATLQPVTEGHASGKVTLTSKDAQDIVLNSSWFVMEVVTCNTIAELKQEAAKGEGYSLLLHFKGEALVTYVSRPTSGSTVYLQDNTAAISVSDTYWPVTIKIGDKLTDFLVKEGVSLFGVQPVITESPKVTIVSSDNDVVPQVVTLAELKTNAADYLLKLVKVENVTLDQTSTTFKGVDADNHAIIDKITQNGNEAILSIADDNPLVGTNKPKKADIIGLSANTAGNAIRPRGLADVISKDSPTAIENIALDMLNGNYEIYTVSGMRVEALQPGVNIIRQGDKTYKVVR